jgi:hypothetical protein
LKIKWLKLNFGIKKGYIMTTLPPPGTRKFPDSSLEKKVYGIVDSVSEYIPIVNDRNRLGFGLFKFVSGEGDPPHVLLKSAKIRIEGISLEELAKKIDSAIKELQV